MKNFVVFDCASGRAKRSGISHEDNIRVGSDEQVVFTESYVDWKHCYIKNGAILTIPEKPKAGYEFDIELESWVPCERLIAEEVDAVRKQKLMDSDWTQLPDVPLATKDAWAAYRQALRDITEQPGYPLDITWPNPPQ